MLLICMNRQSDDRPARSPAARPLSRGEHSRRGPDRPGAAISRARAATSFAGVPVTPGRWDEPLFDEALATLECRVAEQTSVATHYVFMAEVLERKPRGPVRRSPTSGGSLGGWS